MPCYIHIAEDGTRIFLRGQLGPHCADCADVADNLCDYPVGKGKTCDRKICQRHSRLIGPDLHYCEAHHQQWLDFEQSGGVKAELENVVPFKKEHRS